MSAVLRTQHGLAKLVVFVPESAKETVKNALFAAGAGQQGAYQCCAWECLGVGQFLPNTGAVPAIGAVDQLTQVPEWRIEMLVSVDRWPAIKAALISAHPYESPAYELWPLLDSGASD